MPETSQYPYGAQTADTNISRDIAGLRGTMEAGFDRLDRRMDSMVTLEAHRADINRIDQRVDHVNEKVDRGIQEVKRDMAEGFEDLKERDALRDKQFTDREEARDVKYSRRMGWTISIVAVGISALTLLFRFIGI